MSEHKCHILKDLEGCGCKCVDSLRARVAELQARVDELEGTLRGFAKTAEAIARNVLAKGKAA